MYKGGKVVVKIKSPKKMRAYVYIIVFFYARVRVNALARAYSIVADAKRA